METQTQIQIPRVKLGSQGLEVSQLGFGCGTLVGYYGSVASEEAVISIIHHAFRNGISFFDTSDAYGPHTNEIFVGKALKQLPRDQVQLATKFGIEKLDQTGMVVNGKPEYVRACCEASLQRLGLDYIDLYYQHRVDQAVPIEHTIGEMKKLVEEGKVKYIGLSEASPDTIRRAHAVHPITAVQMEWSLMARDIEEQIVPLCRELGIGIVPYSPLGRGFFGRKPDDVPANSILALASHPWFSGENLEKNIKVYQRIEKLASKHHCTPAQLALSWLIHQGDNVAPIPGTTKIKNLDVNIGSLQVKLMKEDLQEISDAAKDAAGSTSFGFTESYDWIHANTPPQN